MLLCVHKVTCSRAILLSINIVVVTDRQRGLSALSAANSIIVLLHVILWPYQDNWLNNLGILHAVALALFELSLHAELFSLTVLCIITSVLNSEQLPLSNATVVGVSLLVCLYTVTVVLYAALSTDHAALPAADDRHFASANVARADQACFKRTAAVGLQVEDGPRCCFNFKPTSGCPHVCPSLTCRSGRASCRSG